MEETLKRTAHRAINLWQEFHNQGVSGMVMEVTRLRDLSPLWDVLRQTLDLMHESMDEVNLTTDAPAVYGETYGKGGQFCWFLPGAVAASRVCRSVL